MGKNLTLPSALTPEKPFGLPGKQRLISRGVVSERMSNRLDTRRCQVYYTFVAIIVLTTTIHLCEFFLDVRGARMNAMQKVASIYRRQQHAA